MKITWVSGQNEQALSMNSSTAEAYGVTSETMIFHFGAAKQTVDVRFNPELKPDHVGIPAGWKKQFTIPEILSYQFYREGNNLYLGPVLALIAFKKNEEMTDRRLNSLRYYFRQASALQGLLFICAAEGIDPKTQTIQGYYYDPYKLENRRWKAGIFPYPGAAYNRTTMPKEIFDDMISSNSNRVFNSYTNGSFNKWELWSRLSPIPEISKHLPDTKRYDDQQSLLDMLKLYKSVYLKPAGGAESKGVMKAQVAEPSDIEIIYPYKKAGNGKYQRVLTQDELSEWSKNLIDKEYLIQQAISMARYEDRVLDFRVIMQKDGSNTWTCSGIFGKFGRQGGIVSNFTKAGFVLDGADALQLALGIDQPGALRRVHEMQKLSLHICQVFDRHGHYGDLGIDFIVDTNHQLWLLEVNTLDTYHGFPLHMDNTKLFGEIVSRPFQYANYLAGFSRNGTNKR